MPTQEISSKDWQELCDRFTKLQRDTLVSIETLDGEGRSRVIMDRLPLRSMGLDCSGGCSDILRLEAGDPQRKAEAHTIVEPIHWKIQEESQNGKVMRIEAESGTTLIRFSSGKIGELLDGLKLV